MNVKFLPHHTDRQHFIWPHGGDKKSTFHGTALVVLHQYSLTPFGVCKQPSTQNIAKNPEINCPTFSLLQPHSHGFHSHQDVYCQITHAKATYLLIPYGDSQACTETYCSNACAERRQNELIWKPQCISSTVMQHTVTIL